ncbi:hypothetical protein [Micromonospora sagamiensis]|uniref:Aspartyl/asparaginyl beta-hydroxylase n=1 Tax=Micromonospora sagamiensis TaxID=47875 RepID=A0A562WH81_9ACTN|nr:hypothetical protein [Micromonospora sagamiensis]TWJ29633.1 hypothetical protein JD81_03144 [Micromonospora sagamiensis]BCL17335.1 hypothetical protein GCM10017556_50740 [Micromonospora sagamiensis]
MSHVNWIVSADGEGGGTGLVGRIDLDLDVDELAHAADELLRHHPLIFDQTQQLAVQVRPGSSDPWYESCYQEKDIAPEHEYAELNPELKGTYFEEVVARFPFPVFRTRLMALTARTCYSVHRDDTARLHVAIRTSEHAAFVFVERNEVFRVPTDGNAYLLNTTEVHTALNGARDLRLHLVAGAALDTSR